MDGIVTAREAIHSLKNIKAKGMMIKLDLSKSYNPLRWTYLQSMLEAFGFDPQWINWISSFISTSVLTILLNGAPYEAFNATRGLRQGDPISPSLFILAVEGLGRYVKAKVQEGQFKGLRMWGNDLPLTHQQFVDHIMMFFQNTLKEARSLLAILKDFMNASRIHINKYKSDIFFFNITAQSQAFLARVMGIRIGTLPSKYLGIPLTLNPLKVENWKVLLDKIQCRLQN